MNNPPRLDSFFHCAPVPSHGQMPGPTASPLRGRRRSVRETTNRSTHHVGFAQSPEQSVWSDSSSNSNPAPRGFPSTPDASGRRRSSPRDLLAAALPNEISTLHSRLSYSLASELSLGGELVLEGISPEVGEREHAAQPRFSFDLRDSLEHAPDSGRGVHDGNDSSGSDQGSIRGESSMQTPTPVPLWAMSTWQKRENLARRKFSHQVIGHVIRGREAAHRRLLNASGAGAGGTVGDSPTCLRSSRLESLARSRAETIGDTSATSDASVRQAARDHGSGNVASAGRKGLAGSGDADADDLTDTSVPFVLCHMSGDFSASGESVSSSLLARWHARERKEVICRNLLAWQVYTHASLQSLARIFRSPWGTWRKIVTALSARRRLAVYVLSTRQRLSHALEIWVSLRIKNRALARLGWLHTEKVLGACMRAFRSIVSTKNAFESVAHTMAKVFHAVVLRMHADVWRRQVFVTRYSNERHNVRWRSRTLRTLHAWLSAISQSRANVVAAEWRASEQVERILSRFTRSWRASAEVSSSARRQIMFKAFRRFRRSWDFGCYRNRRICAMMRRQKQRTKRWAFWLLLQDYLQCVFVINVSDKVKTVVSRRILNKYLGGWRYISWRTRRVTRLQRRLSQLLRAEALRVWDAKVRASWRLDIKETQLLRVVTSRSLRSFLGRWLYSCALERKARHRQHGICISRVVMAIHCWRVYRESVHVNRHRNQLIELKSNTRRKQKTFWELRKWHDLRLALAVNSFRARLWARNVLAHTFKHWCQYVSKQAFDRTVLSNLKHKNEETRQTQAIVWWCQRHRHTKFKLSIVAALRFASIGRRALRAWSESRASHARHQRFVLGLGHKLQRAAHIAAVSFTWLLWEQVLARGHATRCVINVSIMQRSRFVHDLFACWATEAVVGHRGRIKIVRMQVFASHVSCWQSMLMLLTDFMISFPPSGSGLQRHNQVDTGSPDSIQARPSNSSCQIGAVYTCYPGGMAESRWCAWCTNAAPGHPKEAT